ncbi:MAG: hypothetical protein AAF648_16055 [Pseudomonadota bacterium]
MNDFSQQSPDEPAAGSVGDLLRSAAVAGLQYLRWTQFVPMVIAWAFALLGLALLMLLQFEGLVMGVLSYLPPWIVDLPGVGWLADQAGAAAETREDGSVRITDELLIPVILRFWAWGALVLWLLGLLREHVLGWPAAPVRPIRDRLLRWSLAVVLIAAVYALAFAFAPAAEGAFWGDLALPIGLGALLLWVISAYCVVVTGVLDRAIAWVGP